MPRIKTPLLRILPVKPIDPREIIDMTMFADSDDTRRNKFLIVIGTNQPFKHIGIFYLAPPLHLLRICFLPLFDWFELSALRAKIPTGETHKRDTRIRRRDKMRHIEKFFQTFIMDDFNLFPLFGKSGHQNLRRKIDHCPDAVL